MAVYTKVSESEVKEFLRAYDIGTLREMVGITHGIQNSNYILTTDKGRYILTLFEQRSVAEKDLPFFLALMDHVAKKGLGCPLPVPSRDGQMLGRLVAHPCAVINFLNGTPIKEITTDHCFKLGRALANLHLATEDFTLKRPNPLSVPTWDQLFAKCRLHAEEVESGLNAIVQDELNFLHKNWPKNLPSGVIHADLFPDNVFLDDSGACEMFDFYYACNDFLMYDLAICMNAWCFEDHEAFNISKARMLIQGYSEVRAPSDDELKALPLLARGAAIRFLLTRLYDWLNRVPDALVKELDPREYLTRLQFHQMVSDIDAYGLNQ